MDGMWEIRIDFGIKPYCLWSEENIKTDSK